MIVDIPGQESCTMICVDYDELTECIALAYLYCQTTGSTCHIEIEELLLEDQSLN